MNDRTLGTSSHELEVQLVAPVYRNRATLEELVARVHASLDGVGLPSHELLLVDDACPEGSASLVAVLAAQDPRVAALCLRRNVGQYRAVMVGLNHSRGWRTVVLDADMQDPPETIPLLLEALVPPVEIVFAARRGRYQSVPRRLAAQGFRWLFHRVTGLPRDASIHMALGRQALDRLLALRLESVFPVAMAGSLGLPTRVVPLERRARLSGTSAYSSVGRLRAALVAFACARECRRQTARPTVSPWCSPELVASRHGMRFRGEHEPLDP